MKIVGAGSGGHGRVVLNTLTLMGGFEMVGWTDPDPTLLGRTVAGFPVLGDDSLLAGLRSQGVAAAFVGVGGVGNNDSRERLLLLLDEQGFSLPNAIHPHAVLADSVTLGSGSVVMAGVVANPGVEFGRNVIVNTGAIVDHDCLVGDHVHIAPGVVLSGDVVVGNKCHIGTGASVIQGVTIGEGAVVGAGAVVVKDVAPHSTVVGVPARELRQKKATRG